MNTYILSFQEIDRKELATVGGKGANLGELSGIRDIQVPEGFCITTEAYKKITVDNQELNRLLDELSHLTTKEREKISEISETSCINDKFWLHDLYYQMDITVATLLKKKEFHQHLPIAAIIIR